MLFISVRFHLLTLLTNLASVHSLQISTLPVLHQSLAVYSVRITKQTVMMMMLNYLGAVYVMETLYWDAMVVMMTCIVEDAISKTYKFSVFLLCIHQSFSLQSILSRLSEISSLCCTPLLQCSVFSEEFLVLFLALKNPVVTCSLLSDVPL